MGNTARRRVYCDHLRRGRSLWRGDGLLAIAGSSRLQPRQVPPRHSRYRARQCAHQRHARAAARTQPPASTIARARADELQYRGGNPRFVRADRLLRHLEHTVACPTERDFLGDLHLCAPHSGCHDRLRRCGGEPAFASLVARLEWRPPRRAQNSLCLARGQFVSWRPALLDSPAVHRVTRVAGRISPAERFSRQLLRNGLPRHRPFVFILNPLKRIEIMNDPNTPPIIPNPALTALPAVKPASPPDAGPDEQTPIPNVLTAVESILRHPGRVQYQLRQAESGRLIAVMLFVAAGCSLIYGVIVGTFSGGTQLWVAPVKCVIGLLLSCLICLPSLYIFACLSGSQARPAEVGGLVAGLAMLLTI